MMNLRQTFKTLLAFAIATTFSATAFAQTTYQTSGLITDASKLFLTGKFSTSGYGSSSVMFHDNADQGTTTNSWSAAQTLPFTFEFYGSPVTQFCVSKNRLLTFDASVAGTIVNSALDINTALPDANLPNNTIAYYWGDFGGLDGDLTSSNDDVWYVVAGTAPNRQLWIINNSYKIENMSGTQFSYNSLVLEETTNKIYTLDSRNSVLGGSYTVGVQQNATTAEQIAGSPNIGVTTNASNPDINTFPFYEFTPVVASTTDIGLALLNTPNAFGCFTAPEPVSATLINFGSQTIDFATDNVNITAELRGTTTQNVVTTLNTGSLPSGDSLVVNIGNINLSAVGSYTLRAYPTLAANANASNDTTSTLVFNTRPTLALPLTVDFTGYNGSNLNNLFPGWTEANGTSGSTPDLTDSSAFWADDNFANASGGSNSAKVTNDGLSVGDKINEWIISPKFVPVVNTAVVYRLAFTTQDNTSSRNLGIDDSLKVMVSTDCGQTFTTLKEYTSATPVSNTGQIDTVDLTAFAGMTVQVAFYAVEGTTDQLTNVDIFLDDIEVKRTHCSRTGRRWYYRTGQYRP